MPPLLLAVRTGVAPGSSEGFFSEDSFLQFQTKKLIRSGNLEDGSEFCCLEPLEQRTFVTVILTGFPAGGRLPGRCPTFFPPFPGVYLCFGM